MSIKLYYRDPSCKDDEYDKELLCPTCLTYETPANHFKFKFACEVSSIADNNKIARDLVYKAELLDEKGDLIFERKGVPLKVEYKSHIIDIFAVDCKDDLDYWFDSNDIRLGIFEGKIYINRTNSQWNLLEKAEQDIITKKISSTLERGIYDIKLPIQKIYFIQRDHK